nr:protein SINE1-like isoform X1 [Malus domestica]
MSSESQTLDSFAEYDSFVETPITMSCQCSRNSIYDCRSVNRKLWSHENGGVDVSLKDGFFSEIAQGSAYSNGYPGNPGINEFVKCEGDSNEEFTGSSKQILKMEYQEAPQLVLGLSEVSHSTQCGQHHLQYSEKACSLSSGTK